MLFNAKEAALPVLEKQIQELNSNYMYLVLSGEKDIDGLLEKVRSDCKKIFDATMDICDDDMVLGNKRTGNYHFFSPSFSFSIDGDVNVIEMDEALPNGKGISPYLKEYRYDLEKAFKKNLPRSVERVQQIAMIFVNWYVPGKNERDADNYYIKTLSDIVTAHFVNGDDNPKNVQYISLALPSKNVKTTVYLVPMKKLSSYFAKIWDKCEFMGT